MKRPSKNLLKQLNYRFASEKLKSLREIRGVSIETLVRAIRSHTGLRISKQGYNLLETGQCLPSLATFLALVEFFNIPDFSFWFVKNGEH